MGKYMRKCRAAGGGKVAPAVVERRAPAALGVRTRSRAAAFDAKVRRKKQQRATAARAVEDALLVLGRDGGGDAAAGCYLHLRSRRLFMPAATAVADRLRGQGAGEEASTAGLADSGPSVEVAGVSRCSSTASTAVDMAARERSGDEAEQACESRDVESSVSDSECGGRDRRETTPSSRSPVDLSDLESSQAAHGQRHKRRRHPATTTTTTAAPFHLDLQAGARMPPAAEIDEFFAAAEKAQGERFAAKYNFDVARGVPLNAGRFEWTTVATV